MEQINAATTKKRATPPTVSQLMAAKRAVKERNEAYQETNRQIAPTGYADRNLISSIRAAQARNRIAMQKGAPESLDERLTDNIRNLMHFESLVYTGDIISYGVIEKTIRAHRVIASIYDDANLLDATRRAEQALNDLADRRAAGEEPSPNQCRAILKPVVLLIGFAAAYAEIVPAAAVQLIAEFCSSVQASIYTTALYDRPLRYVVALFDIIKGASLRQMAKTMGEKENALRDQILDAAHCFYRIAECSRDCNPPESIPQLRQPAFQELADLETLYNFLGKMAQGVMIPFEQRTGITLINYTGFKKQIERIQLGHIGDLPDIETLRERVKQ